MHLLNKVGMCFTEEIKLASHGVKITNDTVLTNLGRSQKKGYFWINKYYQQIKCFWEGLCSLKANKDTRMKLQRFVPSFIIAMKLTTQDLLTYVNSGITLAHAQETLKAIQNE